MEQEAEVCDNWEERVEKESTVGALTQLLEQELGKIKIEQKPEVVKGPEYETPPSITECQAKMKLLRRSIEEVKPTEEGDFSELYGVQVISPRTSCTRTSPRVTCVLSRPKNSPDNGGQGPSSAEKSKNQPTKTLEQREEEYAEARRRIFGDENGVEEP